jgi:hypothetical protein
MFNIEEFAQGAEERAPERKRMTDADEDEFLGELEMRRKEEERTKNASPDFGPPTQDERDLWTAAEARRQEELLIRRDPGEEVDVTGDRESVEVRLEALAELKKEHLRKAKGGNAESVKELQRVEKAEGHFKRELSAIEKAKEYNEVLAQFSEMKKEDLLNLESIAKHGLDKHNGDVKLFDREHNPLHLNSGEIKKLAGLALSGVKHVTWDQLSDLFEVADTIIHEVFVSTAKRMLGWKN